jgi:probable H4MPT-linked C1 transfer pathway protein
MTPNVLGLDVGGANLKAAHVSGVACLRAFELWKNPAGLSAALKQLLQELPPFDLLAVTMTGELCDCFATKRAGVCSILEAVTLAAGPVPIRVWRTDRCFVDDETARSTPLQAAAANWLALATFAGRFAPHGPAILIDLGSTTTDIVPLLDGQPIPDGRTDVERLRTQELVYTGVRRTPVCALQSEGLAAELFATTLDVHLVLGHLPEDAADHHTADGRPATRAAAHARLARMLGADMESCSLDETHLLAQRTWKRQSSLIGAALNHVAARLPLLPQTLILSGSGEFLLPAILDAHARFARARTVSLSAQLGPVLSTTACAYAVAMLAQEWTERNR